MFDFPSAPAVGDKYPVAPAAGQPQYTWDGEKWTLYSSVPSSVIPVGTTMVFYQAAAPVGWTKVTTHNDKALRVVSGAGGGAGGVNPFSTVMAQSVVGNKTLALADLPTGITSPWTNTTYVYANNVSSNVVPYSYDSQMTYTLGILQSATAAVPPGYPVPFSVGTRADAFSGATYFYGAASGTGTSNNTGGGAHNHPITMNIQYCDVIICSKN